MQEKSHRNRNLRHSAVSWKLTGYILPPGRDSVNAQTDIFTSVKYAKMSRVVSVIIVTR